MLLAGSFAVINNISYDQITATIGAEMTGIFTTCFFIGVVVEMPKRNMAKVMMPLISKAYSENNYQTIDSIYKRSSITMSVIGLLFTIGIITNLQDLFNFIPKGSSFQTGFWVVIFVCIAKMTLMISSFAGEIINYSHKYHFNLYFQVLSAIMLITMNYFLIPKWGISGAGFSYMTSILFHIFLKAIFVKKLLNTIPLTKSHLILLLISASIFLLAFLFQPDFHPVINIGLRALLTGLLFLILIYRFNISDDINRLIRNTFERFLKITILK